MKNCGRISAIMRCDIYIEQGGNGYGAYAPTLPCCIAVAEENRPRKSRAGSRKKFAAEHAAA